ncbi:hypothetical protein niasHT_014521 [Heterodera trifolii]|uniref:BTB/POZ domain-containing protein n=1 Tax=Heterodera trifolii TaxID=157864 RepID=A0ABD2L0D8_9BILA
MTELERLQKINSEKRNEENGKKMKTAKPDTLADRMKLLLSNAKFADAHFLVGKYDEKELVPAHRNILSNYSDVFEAMFQKEATENANGKIASTEKDGPVLVPDVDAEAFKVMLRFIYSDDLSELNAQNAVELLYAALKFNVIALVKALADFPIPKLSNVFAALSIARFNDLLKDFVQRCLAYIDKNADDLIKSEEFLQIDQKLLCEIFERDELQISGEISIWNAALRWADAKCRENGIECTAMNRRAMLGPALFKIRFLLFSQEDFSEKIVPSDVLSKDEVIAIYQFNSLPNRHSLWHFCVCSATYRIVSQNNRTENSTGIISDLVFDNKSTKKGFYNFISFAELMDLSNGFYDKWNNKVTLAIDVITVDELKMDKLILGQSKSKGTLFMDIEKVSEFAREVFLSARISESVTYIKGLPWKISAQIKTKRGSTDNEKYLGIFLSCAAPKQEKWSCKCSATFRIVSQKCGAADFKKEFSEERSFNSQSFARGFPDFISFAELLDPEKGFYDKGEDKVTLAIDVTVKEAKMEDKS